MPLLLGGCLLGQCLPLLVVRVLPFHDAPGVMALGSVFAHLDQPETRVREFYEVDFGAYPSITYFGWAYLAALVGVPVDLAFSAFLALFCLAGPPLALVVLLRAFARPPALALLALPVGYHQQIWFGFLGSAAAVTGLILALAFAKRIAEQPWKPPEQPAAPWFRRAGDHLGLAGATLFVALAHPFTLALTLLVVTPLLFVPVLAAGTARERWAARGLRLACFLPTLAFLASWARSFFGEHPAEVAAETDLLANVALTGSWSDRLLTQLTVRRPPLLDDLRIFGSWLGGGYTAAVDEVVVLVAVAVLASFLVAGVRPGAGPAAIPRGRWAAAWLGWAVLVLAAGYLFLPNKVYWPTYWWGVRYRCVLPLFLLAVVAVRVRPRGLPAWAAAPAVAAALLFAGYVTADFRGHWKGRVLDGFDEAIAAIPPGQTVLAFPALPETHYTHGHPYLIQHYVVRRGGRASPYLVGHPGSYWVTARPLPEAPPWGDPAAFVWSEHGLGYDYFVHEVPIDRAGVDPMARVPAGAVSAVSSRGRWRVYRRERPPRPDDDDGRSQRP